MKILSTHERWPMVSDTYGNEEVTDIPACIKNSSLHLDV